MNEDVFTFDKQEENMTREFICGLYKLRHIYDYKKGINPYDVYHKQFSQINRTENQIRIIVDKLVNNNLKRKDDNNLSYIEYVENTGNIRITKFGKIYCKRNCDGTGDPKVSNILSYIWNLFRKINS